MNAHDAADYDGGEGDNERQEEFGDENADNNDL